MKYILSVGLFLWSLVLFSQQVNGVVVDEENNLIPAAMIFNMKSEKKAYTNLQGEFSLEANPNDELRIVRKGYERNSVVVSSLSFQTPIRIVLDRSPESIEEVKVSNIRLSGNIDEDSKRLTKNDKLDQLKKEIGVPAPPEKPREKPAEVGRDVLLPIVFGQLNVQAVYDVISGKAKRQKRLYKYEDLHDNIDWVTRRFSADYFANSGIPRERIAEFVQYAIGKNPDLLKYIKAKNITKISMYLDDALPSYLENQKK